MCWYAESDGSGTAVSSRTGGSVSGDQGLNMFEYIVVRNDVGASVSEDRVSDMFSRAWVEPQSGAVSWVEAWSETRRWTSNT